MPGKKYIGLEIFFNGKPDCKLDIFFGGMYRLWMTTDAKGMWNAWWGPKDPFLPSSTIYDVPGVSFGHLDFVLQGYAEQLYHTHPQSKPMKPYDLFHIPRGRHLWMPIRSKNTDCYGVGMSVVVTPIYVDKDGFVPLDVVKDDDIHAAEKANLTYAGYFWQGFPTQWVSKYLEKLQIKEGKAEIFVVDCKAGTVLASSTGYTAVKEEIYGADRAVPKNDTDRTNRWELPYATDATDNFVKQVSREMVAALDLKTDWSNFPSKIDLSVGKENDGKLNEEIIIVASRVTEEYRVDWAVVIAVSKKDVLLNLESTNYYVFGAILVINLVFKIVNMTILPIVVVSLLLLQVKVQKEDEDEEEKEDQHANIEDQETPVEEKKKKIKQMLSFGQRTWTNSTSLLTQSTSSIKKKLSFGQRTWSKGIEDTTRPDSNRKLLQSSVKVVPFDEQDEQEFLDQINKETGDGSSLNK